MSDARADDPVPRKPGEGTSWRWAQVAGLLMVLAALPARIAIVRLLEPSVPVYAFDEGFLGRDAWRMTLGAAVLFGLVVVGLPLAISPRRVLARPALVAGMVSLAAAMVMIAYHAAWKDGRAFTGDASLFFSMAEDWPARPGGWFRYRVLGPWLAKTIGGAPDAPNVITFPPGGAHRGWFLLSLFSVAATGPALSLLLRDLKFGTAARHLGVLLYLCSFATLYNTWNYAMPDPLAMLVLVLACRAIVRGRDWELAVWLVLGGLTKEVVLFVVPVRWLWARREGLGIPQALRAGLVALPALAVFAWLRFRPDEVAEYTGFVTGNAWLYPWREQPDNVARLYSPFAAGWALVALSLRRPDRWTIAAIGFAIPCLLSLLVTDAGRMLVYLTPFAIPAILRAAGADERVSRRGLIAVLLVCLSMRLWEPFAPLWKIPELVRRPAALLLIPVVIWLVRRPAEHTEGRATDG